VAGVNAIGIGAIAKLLKVMMICVGIVGILIRNIMGIEYF
jgi:hypothetical protein